MWTPKDYIIAKFSYSYRPDGLIERILEWSPRGEKQLSYEYDAVQRLAAVSDSAGKSWRSSYDSSGQSHEGDLWRRLRRGLPV